jgi:hypothetical protein
MKSLYPYDSGEKILIEQCERLEINNFIRKASTELKRQIIESELLLKNKIIELVTSNTAFGGIRHWFQCPICLKRVAMLFIHPITQEPGCRKCLNLEYRSRKYKGMIENSLHFKRSKK